ncbi:MAG: ABC transporter ATP-binding protein [Spirochaetia bacterium]|nr:ABC transporter ATP-binding protein [Spirochaetia bacterium]
MINFKNLSKQYQKDKPFAVDNLNLEVKKGEIFGFLGPNGAGKSTTINMLMGVLKPTSGSIIVDGHSVGEESMITKSMIGFVPDEPLFYERMTGLQHLSFICDVFNVDKSVRKERSDRLVKLFNLEKAISDRISSYSHGMKQKLGVISALIHEPKLLILDEPMVGLDPKASFILKDVMRRFCDKGGTVFFSTHVMEVAQNLCDSIAIINKGEIVLNTSLKDFNEKENASLENLFLELTGNEDLEAVVDEAML